MSDRDLVRAIVDRVNTVHELVANGCKSSCRVVEVGYYEDRSGYAESYWFARFGGYCIGNLGRWEEVKAPSLEALHDVVDRLLRREVKE